MLIEQTIPTEYEADYLADIELLNKKLARRSLPPVVIQQVKRWSESVNGTFRLFSRVTIDGPEFIHGEEGYDLLGRVVFEDDVPFVTYASPGCKVRLSSLDLNNLTCDHCHTKRDRKEYYFFQDTEGRVISIGSSCAENYFDHQLAQLLPAISSLFIEFEDAESELGESVGRYSAFLPLQYIIAATSLVTKRGTRPWISKDSPNYTEVPTTVSIRESLFGDSAVPHKALTTELDVLSATTDFYSRYASFLSKLNSTEPSSLSPFEENIVLTLMDGSSPRTSIPEKRLGIAAYAIYKCLTPEIDDSKTPSVNEHIGAVGTKVELDITVTGWKTIDGPYGTSTLILFKDPDGRSCKVFTTAPWCPPESIGKRFKIRGTVKAHETFNGTKVTVFKLIKVLEDYGIRNEE